MGIKANMFVESLAMPTRCQGTVAVTVLPAIRRVYQEDKKEVDTPKSWYIRLPASFRTYAPYTNNIDRPEQDRTGQVTKGQA